MVAVGDKVRVTGPSDSDSRPGWARWDGLVVEVVGVESDGSVRVEHPEDGSVGFLFPDQFKALNALTDLRAAIDSLRSKGYTVEVKVTPPGTPFNL